MGREGFDRLNDPNVLSPGFFWVCVFFLALFFRYSFDLTTEVVFVVIFLFDLGVLFKSKSCQPLFCAWFSLLKFTPKRDRLNWFYCVCMNMLIFVFFNNKCLRLCLKILNTHAHRMNLHATYVYVVLCCS